MTVTISDDDPAPVVSWQAGNFSVFEGAGSGLATVLLSAPSAFTVTVVYSTTNGTATAGVPPSGDYTAQSGTLTYPPGVTSQSASISIRSDTADEGDETFNLTLSAPTNATLGSPNPASMTILNDDGTPQPTEEFYTYDQIGNLLSKTGIGSYSGS